MQYNAEVDEPEATAVPTLPHVGRLVLAREDPSADTIVDTMREEDLLSGMEKLTPVVAPTRSEGNIGTGELKSSG